MSRSLHLFPILILVVLFACKSEDAPSNGGALSSTPALTGPIDPAPNPNACSEPGLFVVPAGEIADPVNTQEEEPLNASVQNLLRNRGQAHELKLALQSRIHSLRQRAKRDPRSVLKARLSASALAQIPQDAASCLEQPTQEEGEVEVLEAFSENNEITLQVLFTSTSGKKRQLHFAGTAPGLQTGDKVRIQGLALPFCGTDSAAEPEPTVIDSETQGLEVVQAAILPSTFGPQNTAVVLVGFSDLANTYTLEKTQDVFFNQVHNYLLETSYGQTSLTGQVFGPYSISLSRSGCDSNSIASLANAQASQRGVNLSQYRRIVYVFPKNGCSWLGLGTIGGNPSRSWINGSLVLHTVAHELGHNLGLYHSNAMNCGSASIASSCSTIEYGDTTDIMGNLVAGHYNAFQKERLGWLGYGAQPQIATASASGIFELEPYSLQGSSRVKAVKVLRSTNSAGKKTYYYVEYRQPTGFDSALARSSSYNLTSGVVIHQGSEVTANSSYLLNMNPTQSSWYKAALGVGQTFTDSTAGVQIKLVSANPNAATVSVTLGNSPVPRLVLSTRLVKQVFRIREQVRIALEAVSDSAAAAGADFTLEVREPNGNVVRQTGVLDSEGKATVTLGISACASGGTYQVASQVKLQDAQTSDAAVFSVSL
ncbi:MAG: M12 family metallo-peptidase [Bdellovibrionota bacterium]